MENKRLKYRLLASVALIVPVLVDVQSTGNFLTQNAAVVSELNGLNLASIENHPSPLRTELSIANEEFAAAPPRQYVLKTEPTNFTVTGPDADFASDRTQAA